MGWGMAVALLVSLFIAFAIFHMMKRLLPLVINGVLGIVVFWLLSIYGIIHAPIDLLTFLVAAFGGIFGVGVVLLLTWLGVPL